MFDSYKDVDAYKEQNGYIINGTWYPRVTKIVSIKAKPALMYFYGEAASYKAAKAITEKSAEEGTLIHEISEAMLLGKNPEIPLSVAPAIAAFADFMEMKNIQTMPEYVERRISHVGHRYAGTIDAMALIDGKFGVLDIKTSQGIYRDYNLQTAAYVEALTDEFKNLQTRWILRIDQIQDCMQCGATMRTKGGREKIKRPFRGQTCSSHEWAPTRGVIELKEFPYWHDDFQAFLGAKKLWEWEDSEWLKKIGYI
ncbi:MAG: hypothetical protein Q7S28_03840 [bacterium]|nr:hypothetical protein [bacterium]